MKQSPSIFISYNSNDKQRLIWLNKEINTARQQLQQVGAGLRKSQRQLFSRVYSYQRQLDLCTAELAIPYTPAVNPDSPFGAMLERWQTDRVASLERKKNALRRLVAMGIQLLAQGRNPGLELEFHRLEVEMSPAILLYEDIEAGLFSAPTSIAELKAAISATIYQRMKELQADVRVVIKKIRIRFVPDLRQRFRSIMHFLFKNLDDCADEHKARILFQALCIIKNNYSNVNKYKGAYPHSANVSG